MALASSIWRATFAWLVMQACTTYDGIAPGGAAGQGGALAGGGSAHAGSAQGGDPGSSTGGSTSGNSGSSSAGSVNAEAGFGGTTEGGAPNQVDGTGGLPDVAGAPSAAGGVSSGGVPGEAGAAGAGGSAAECISAAPDVGCTCELRAPHEYWFCNQYLTFAAAESKCKSVKMHLPKIETQSEDDWLFAAAQSHLLGEYFLGATDAATPDEWSWLAGGKFWTGVADGTPTGYTHWSANEPNASGDCLVVQGNGPWDDRTCTDQRRYVCESQ